MPIDEAMHMTDTSRSITAIGVDEMPDERDGTDAFGFSRRSFVIGLGGAAGLLALGGTKMLPAKARVCPPGGQNEDRLIGACIRCERCVEACPNGVIALSRLEDGLLAARTPVMTFDDNWCDFCEEANGGTPRCVACCPTCALALEPDAEAATTIIGKAEITKDWCLAYRLLNGCRFCVDACPYEALEVDDEGRPVVIPDKCNGCGACEAACVSLKDGSIAEDATARAISVKPEEEVES